MGGWDQNGFWEIGWGLEWIQLAEVRDRLRGLVSAMNNLRVLAPWS
jgi:hypothetical protein